jgi:hypothetical protein
MKISESDDYAQRTKNYLEAVQMMLSKKITMDELADICFEFSERYKLDEWRMVGIELLKIVEGRKKIDQLPPEDFWQQPEEV